MVGGRTRPRAPRRPFRKPGRRARASWRSFRSTARSPRRSLRRREQQRPVQLLAQVRGLQRRHERLGLLDRRVVGAVLDHVQGPAVLRGDILGDCQRRREVLPSPDQRRRARRSARARPPRSRPVRTPPSASSGTRVRGRGCRSGTPPSARPSARATRRGRTHSASTTGRGWTRPAARGTHGAPARTPAQGRMRRGRARRRAPDRESGRRGRPRTASRSRRQARTRPAQAEPRTYRRSARRASRRVSDRGLRGSVAGQVRRDHPVRRARPSIACIQCVALAPGPCRRTSGGPSPPSSTAVATPASPVAARRRGGRSGGIGERCRREISSMPPTLVRQGGARRFRGTTQPARRVRRGYFLVLTRAGAGTRRRSLRSATTRRAWRRCC